MSIRYENGIYLADTARVIGDVTLGRDVNIWYGATIRGDVAPVTIGDRTNIQDNAVVHCDYLHPNVIGCDCVIGHGAIVHGEFVGDNTLIGMGAIVLGRSRIGSRCLIAAGALVPQGSQVPDGVVVMGSPAKVIRKLNDKDAEYLDNLPKHYLRLAQRHVEHPTEPWVHEADQNANRPPG